MALEILGRGKVQASGLVCSTDELCLGLRARLSNTGRLAIGVGASVSNDSSDGISISQSIGESLDHHATNAFSSPVPIGAIIKTVRDTLRAQHVNGGELLHSVGIEYQIHTRHEGLRQWFSKIK